MQKKINYQKSFGKSREDKIKVAKFINADGSFLIIPWEFKCKLRMIRLKLIEVEFFGKIVGSRNSCEINKIFERRTSSQIFIVSFSIMFH